MGTKFAGARNMGCGKRVSPFQSLTIKSQVLQNNYFMNGM